MDTTIKEGKYVYCIIESSEPKTFGPFGIGALGDELYAVCFNDIAAVVSKTSARSYAVSSENVFAHEKAVEEVMKSYIVLPVRFNTVVNDEGKIKLILEKEYNRFKDLLEEMKDKKELGLKVIFKEDIIYTEIVEKNKDIRKMKEKIRGLSADKTYYERIKIGKLVEEALENEKEKCREEFLASLEPLAEEVKINDPYGERMILNAAFLVTKEKEKEFDQEVNNLEEKYSDKMRFKYVGTLPPFNFVNLVIITEKYAEG